MIFITRDQAAPPQLRSIKASREMNLAKDRYKNWTPGCDIKSFEFTAYRNPNIKAALLKMSHYKCAYCESAIENGSMDIEHYRPKGGIIDDDTHPGYWWLAFEWTNLLPSCRPCNSAIHQHVVTEDVTLEDFELSEFEPPEGLYGKAQYFPINNSRLIAPINDHFFEDALLIDPTRMDPEPSFKWLEVDALSIVIPASGNGVTDEKGKTTIECFGLNRIGLVRHRSEKLLELQRMRKLILGYINNIRDSAECAKELREPGSFIRVAIESISESTLSNKKYAGMCRAFLCEFEKEIGELFR